jgi:hypothetical protein
MNYLTFALEIAQVLFLVTAQRCWIDTAYHQLRQPVDDYCVQYQGCGGRLSNGCDDGLRPRPCTVGYTFLNSRFLAYVSF